MSRNRAFLLGAPVMGPISQTLVARQQESGQVVGLATRSVRPLFVNGQAEDVGYIGQLRVEAAHRGRWLVPAGFRLFHQLRQSSTGPGYITTIIEGHAEAEGLLVEKARRRYPAYRHRGAHLYPGPDPAPPPAGEGCPRCWKSARTQVELDEIVAFLQREGRRKQFFPVYSAEDFTGPRLLGLRREEVAVALRGGKVVGVLALWDQSAYKQTVVRAYRDNLRRIRPLYNLGAELIGTATPHPHGPAYPLCLCLPGLRGGRQSGSLSFSASDGV